MTSQSTINLIRGWPHPSLLPNLDLASAAQRALTNLDIAIPGMLYGPDNGFAPLRASIAKWLTEFYQPSSAVTPARITITGGASQNLGCVLQVFTDPLYTRNVWMVSPAYMLAFRMFEDAGLCGKLRAVPEDDEGIDVGYLRGQLEKCTREATDDAGTDGKTLKPARPWGKFYRHVIYAVPTFSNPSAKIMSLRRREEVVRLAREYDALVITDDVYDFLQWPASLVGGDGGGPDPPSSKKEDKGMRNTTLPRIVDVDRFLDGGAERPGADGFGNAASNGTFTKICGPGVRTGWVEGTSAFAWGVSQAGTSRSGGAPSQLTATLINEMLEAGDLQRHVYETLQPVYGRRHAKMLAAIHQHLLPLGVSLDRNDKEKPGAIDGGYFIWLTLPSQVTSSELAKRSKDERGVLVAQGDLFEVPGHESNGAFPNSLRLCFAWENYNVLDEGVRRLAEVLRALLEEHSARSTTHVDTASRSEGGEERPAHNGVTDDLHAREDKDTSTYW